MAGVSGGPDSLTLLHALVRLGCPVIAAHLDHSLRAESGQDAETVRQAAEQLGVPFVGERQDVAGLARREGHSIEEAARYARYRFLFRTAAAHEAEAVAVGHTADDQVETVLMHLLRGAGLAGLRGMACRSLPNPWSGAIPLVRPLLETWRTEIMEYVNENDLHPVMDASNTDPAFYRNRLRHEALPYLESLNPGVRRRLWQTAELLCEDDEVIEGVVERAWQLCRMEEGEGFIALHVKGLRRQPTAVVRRVLRRAAGRLRPGLRDIDYAAIRRAVGFLQTPARSGQADWIAGLRLEMEGERLWVTTWEADLPGASWPQVTGDAELRLELPGSVALSDGWRLTAEILDSDHDSYTQAAANSDPFCAWLDYETLVRPLVVRGRRPGERFRPQGMGGHSLKLSDFMINVGMPRRARDAWPLIMSGDDIAWVPGYRIGDAFIVREISGKAARLRAER